MDKSLQRIYLFDNLKGILIFLVVFGHMLTKGTDSTIVAMVYYMIYVFHMPVFVLLSGYFSKNVEKAQSISFKTLLIPYFVINIAMIIFEYILGSTKDIFTINIFLPKWGVWYLLAMFVWKILIADISKMRQYVLVCFVIGLLAGLFISYGRIMELGRIFAFLPFFALGHWLQEKHIEKISSLPKIIGAIIGIFLVVSSYCIAKYELIPKHFFFMRDGYKEHDISYTQGLLSRGYIYIVAILCFIALVILVTKKQIFLEKIGQSTITIYIAHLFIVPEYRLVLVDKIENPFILLFVSAVSAAVILFVFSRKFITTGYNFIFKYIYKVIYKKE